MCPAKWRVDNKHILLVDPDRGSSRNLAFLLRLAGFRVMVVGNPDEAINLACHFLGTEQRHDAMVVTDAASDMLDSGRLRELKRVGVAMPVIFLGRAKEGPGFASDDEALKVYPCRSEGLIPLVKGLV